MSFLQFDYSIVGAAGVCGAHRGSGSLTPAQPSDCHARFVPRRGPSEQWWVALLAAPEFATLVGFPMIFGLRGVLGAHLEPVAHMGGLALRPWPQPLTVTRGSAQGNEIANGGVLSPWSHMLFGLMF